MTDQRERNQGQQQGVGGGQPGGGGAVSMGSRLIFNEISSGALF